MTHTDGPWVVRQDFTKNSKGSFIPGDGTWIESAHGAAIAHFPDWLKRTNSPVAGNQALMCAAPDMLAALKDVYSLYCRIAFPCDGSDQDVFDRKIINQVVDAISKAECQS